MDEANFHDWTPVELKDKQEFCARDLSAKSKSTMSIKLTNKYSIFLLPAEDVYQEALTVHLVNIDILGTLVTTNFRLLFISRNKICNLGTMPVATIEKFAKLQQVRSRGSQRLLQIVGKDMRTLVFGFRPHGKDRRKVLHLLQDLTKPSRLDDLYAFKTEWASFCPGTDGDARVRVRQEYERIIKSHNNYWTFSDVNSDYMLCPTYPSHLVVPKSLSNEEIQQGADFRARGRLPALCWQHPDNGAVLARSSQPLIGIMMNSRSNADEKLVAALCVQSAAKRRKLYIADARPRKNAFANGAMGGGSESSANYFQCEVVFLGIDNIHAMRDSFSRLREYLDIFGAASSDGSSSLLRGGGSIWGGGNLSSTAAAVSALADSGWLAHIHSLLASAAWIAARVADEEASVLVHCSDGWDRTTQLVSLAQMMLDPHYRTFEGFQALIEKDWLAFGHPFADRLGIPTISGSEPLRSAPTRNTANTSSQSSGASYDNSPIFLQWVDCISHLLRLYPRAFEFSSAYLVDLLDAVLSCRFGNFLCNSEKERVHASIQKQVSACIWTYFRNIYKDKSNRMYQKYHNVFYSKESSKSTLLPPAATLAPSLWPQFYFRWNFHPEKTVKTKGIIGEGLALDEDIQAEIQTMYRRVASSERGKSAVESEIQEMQKAIKNLQEELEIEKEKRMQTEEQARRARKETVYIKRSVETLGSKIKFPDPDEINSEPDYRSPDSPQFYIKVSVLNGVDMSSRKEFAAPTPPGGEGGDTERYKLESAMEGLCVDYEALERLSKQQDFKDLYFSHVQGVT